MSSTDSRDKIDEIKDRLDIVDVIEKSVNLHHIGGNEYAGTIGQAGSSGESLKVDKDGQVWKDFKNGKGGDVFDWIGYINGLDTRGADFPEVLRIAADLAGVELEEMTEEERDAAKEKADIQTLFTAAADIYHRNLTPELYDYIKEKWGITKETVDKLKIGYATINRDLKELSGETLNKSGLIYVNDGKPGGEVFQGRIIFPYWKNGKVVYLIGRETEETPEAERENGMKYKKLLVHKEGREYISHSVQNSYFYGEDSLRGSDYCIITEGVADCISMLQAGFPCISPVTVQFREKDNPKLISLTNRLNRVYICNDNEANKAGLKGALNTAEALESTGIEARLITLPKPDGIDKIDIADYMKEHSREDFKELIDSSIRLWGFKLNQVEIKASSTSIERLRAFRSFISNDLHLMQLDEWQVFVNNEVPKMFGLTKKDVKTTIEDVTKRRQGNEEEARERSKKEDSEGGEEENAQRKLPPLEERLKAYPEEVIRKANDILDNGDPFIYLCDVWNKIHVGDRNLGEMLACSIACTQVLNAGLGIHEKPSGDAESGKSHACLSMGKLCPTWKFRSTTFSPKVLYYMKDLLPGTIIYTDDIELGDKGVISTVKKVTADFEEPTIMDTVIDGKPAKMSIPERLGIWLSSCDSIDDVQLGTRFIFSNTESGDDHDHEVNHKQKGRCLGAVPEECNEEVLVCRCMLEYICDNLYNVFSAYGFVSTWSEESKKRNQEKFLDVLLSVTVFNYRQRKTINGNLIGTLEDWKRAVSIYSHVAQNNSCMLTDEEIIILHTIHTMGKAYDGEGVPHKRLLAYMKETNKFKKSDSSLKRILLGDRTGGKQGFKEKVPGFLYDKIEIPNKLDDKGFEIKGSGKTRALCYTYDGDLFDGLPEDADIVNTIKNGTFVNCDHEIAEALEEAFREDPYQIYGLKDNSGELEKWKREARNHKKPSEIIRNHQKSKQMDSDKSIQLIPNNNNKINNNKVRNQKIEDKEEGEKINSISSSAMDNNTHNSEHDKTMNSDDFLNSELPACVKRLNSDGVVLNPEPTDSDHILNSEPKVLNSDITSLLKRALIKFARDEYNGTVSDIEEFKREFNKKIPEYQKALGEDAVGFNAKILHMRGWK